MKIAETPDTLKNLLHEKPQNIILIMADHLVEYELSPLWKCRL